MDENNSEFSDQQSEEDEILHELPSKSSFKSKLLTLFLIITVIIEVETGYTYLKKIISADPANKTPVSNNISR